ncbi:MAG: hypothetical protein A3H97_03955 [Acidobacteria bacterium RIFCSPLOWO2_02_FULL_65_29]|nr:MAG: hypothetical protein A3H97_03955 [Acidobacteria bacterium RIFCSPLOWO2_02_FULL_65_29]
MLIGGPLITQSKAASPAQAPASAPSPFLFPSGAALVLNFIKPDKAAEWEGLMDKVKLALQASEKPERKAQAGAWKIYKTSAAGPSGSVIYFWRIDGAPAGVAYSMVEIMTELFPKEARAMYEQYSAAFQNPPAIQIFQLELVNDFSK